MKQAKPTTVDEYIAGFPEDMQFRLHKVRDAIIKAAPAAEEKMSYNMPLYKWNGMLVSFAGWKEHIGLYPCPAVTGEMEKSLAPYRDAKATLKFPHDKPLPVALITQVVRLRLKENLPRVSKRPSKKASRA